MSKQQTEFTAKRSGTPNSCKIKLTPNDRYFIANYLRECRSGLHEVKQLFGISPRYAGNLRDKAIGLPDFHHELLLNSHSEIAKAKIMTQSYPADEIEDPCLRPFYQSLSRLVIEECGKIKEKRRKDTEQEMTTSFFQKQRTEEAGDSPFSLEKKVHGRLSKAAKEVKIESRQWKQLCDQVGLVKARSVVMGR